MLIILVVNFYTGMTVLIVYLGCLIVLLDNYYDSTDIYLIKNHVVFLLIVLVVKYFMSISNYFMV